MSAAKTQSGLNNGRTCSAEVLAFAGASRKNDVVLTTRLGPIFHELFKEARKIDEINQNKFKSLAYELSQIRYKLLDPQ